MGKRKTCMNLFKACEHCGREVHEHVDGGLVELHFAITGLPTRTTYMHDRCLGAFLRKAESGRKRINGQVDFSFKT